MRILITNDDSKGISRRLAKFLESLGYSIISREDLRVADVIIGIIEPSIGLSHIYWEWAELNHRPLILVEAEEVEYLSHRYVSVNRFNCKLDEDIGFTAIATHLKRTLNSPEDVEDFIYKYKISDFSHVDPNETQAQESILIANITLLDIGMIATYGIENEEIVLEFVHEIARLGDQSKPFAITRYSESSFGSIISLKNTSKISYEEMHLSPELKSMYHQVFIIVLIQGHSESGELKYSWVNVRLDRLDKLLEIRDSGKRFNLANYSTVITSGKNSPSDEEKRKMYHNYLFGTDYINVRIMPPLHEFSEE